MRTLIKPDMTPQSKFIVELTPPSKIENLDKYYARVSNLVRLTGQVSITSKHEINYSIVRGQSFALARYLLERQPTIDILFHVRARDTYRLTHGDFVDLDSVGITKLLIITGDNHPEPGDYEANQLIFANSHDMLGHINSCGSTFKTLAIAGYPGGDGRRTYNNKMELERLSKKLKIRADAIYTQCVFDDKSFCDFKELITREFPRVEIIPSVALFKNEKDLDKIANMTRISGTEIESVKHKFQYISDAECAYEYSLKYVQELCRKLIESGASKIDLCTFGNYEMAEDLISRLEKK